MEDKDFSDVRQNLPQILLNFLATTDFADKSHNYQDRTLFRSCVENHSNLIKIPRA